MAFVACWKLGSFVAGSSACRLKMHLFSVWRTTVMTDHWIFHFLIHSPVMDWYAILNQNTSFSWSVVTKETQHF